MILKSKLIAFIIVLLPILLVLFNSACKKDATINKENEEKTAGNADYWVCDGVLHFKSSETYHNLVDSLVKLNYNEFSQWEQSVGFASFWTEQQEILKQVDTITTEEEFYKIAAENPRFVYLNDNEMKLFDIGSNYKLVSNADGVFCINSMYHRVFPKMLEVTQAGDLKSAQLNFSSNKEVFSHNMQEETVFLKSTGCGTDSIFDSNDNNKGKTDYRKVEAYLKIKIDIEYESPCCVTYQQHVDMQIVGKKKNFWGQTYTYSTEHSWSDLEVGFERIYKSGTYPCTNIWDCTSSTCDRILREPYVWNEIPSGQSSEQSVFDLRLYTGPLLYNDPISLSTQFDKARLKAWTRGTTHEVYAAICCNYANCGF